MYNICQSNKQAQIFKNVLYTVFHKMYTVFSTQHVSKLGFFKGSLVTLYAFFFRQEVTDFYSDGDTFYKEINILMFCTECRIYKKASRI